MIQGQLVGLLTIDEKNILEGVQYMPDTYYNPVQDNDDNWIISTEEIDNTTDENYLWVKNLPLIPFNPKQKPVTGTTI
jgi:hypothetical protein